MKREKHFMIDIESTGVDFEVDEVLEIGIVEMDMVNGFWEAGKSFHKFIHSDRQPESEFAKEHMIEVYKAANNEPFQTLGEINGEICDFFSECGREGHGVLFCGWNAANFDVPMLNRHGYLIPPGYKTVDGKDVQVGDHHYRIYEMCGAIQLACDIRQEPYEDFKEQIKTCYDMTLPKGKAHDAIYDCYMQIKMLNGLIKTMRS